MTTHDTLTPIITRIIMRYLSGIIGTAGFIALDDVQAIVAVVVAGILAAAAEVWHARVVGK